MYYSVTVARRRLQALLPDLPLVVWMIAGALALIALHSVAGDASTAELLKVFNSGWGRALGEFALILLPSFAIAAALSRVHFAGAEVAAAGISPLSGAGMVCPDTAYAALSPLAGRRKLATAFGCYAGFKLLFPAGPLLVGVGLGLDVDVGTMVLYGVILLVPVWGIGICWARRHARLRPHDDNRSSTTARTSGAAVLAPFALLAALLVSGAVFDLQPTPLLDLATQPKGALWCAAVLALARLSPGERRDCIDSAVSRSASLLLLIGAASALGALLTATLSVTEYVPAESGLAALLGLFVMTAAFKVIQGSSMATFAAIAPVAAPVVAASGLAPEAAVFAICLGSFIAILPNDSFYWLIRNDALTGVDEARAVRILAVGAVLQAVVGFAILAALAVAEWI